MYVDMTFAGRRAGEFGILVKSHRRVLPERHEELEDIPGIPGQYDYAGTQPEERALAYTMGIIQAECMVKAEDLPSLRGRIREIAAWLAKAGRLSFSDEPDKYYVGKVYGSIMLEQLFSHGQWTIEFKTKPFAYGKAVVVPAIGQSPLTIPLVYGGTAPTPARIILRNIGTTQINGPMRLVHYIKTGGIE